ncbi:MAG: tetratricopeptide repeat protein [Thermoplasmata archaeon]|nr:tetratricopeptide repeat protein [Thermoplasmata archaeon]
MAAGFVGREEELDILKKALSDADSGKGRFFLITGETGIGKTRLLNEFSNTSREHGALVMQTRCTGNGGPYSAVEDAISHFTAGIQEPLPLGLAFSEGTEKGEFVIRARTMVLERFLRKFEEISVKQTCVFLVDDLQWADTGTLNFLHYLSRNVGKLRMVVACAYGTEYTSVENSFTQFLRNLNIERNIRTITLGKLSQSAAAKIVTDILATWRISKKVLDAIYNKTGGNPFFIEEICRVLQQTPSAELENPRFAEALPVPEGVKNLINYRLKCLGESEIKVLRCCAVLGNTFEFEVLRRVVEMDENALLDSLETLINTGYLKEEVEETYSFTQNLLREAVYSEILMPRRKMMHRMAADVLAQLHGENARFAGTIGRHYLLAGEYERGAPFILLAAENALKNYVMEDAMVYADELAPVFEKLPDGEMKQKIARKFYTIIGDCKHITSDFRAAITAYEKGLEVEEEIPRRTEISVKLAYSYLSVGELKKAFETLTSMLAQIPQGEHALRADILGAIGQCYEKTGEFGKALGYYLQALECAHRTENEITIATAYHRAGTGMWFAGELEKALGYLEKALEIRMRHNLKKDIAGTYNNMGIVYLYKGEWEKAVECWQNAKKIWEEIGDMAGVSTTYNNLAGVWSNMGEHEKAIEFAKKDLEISRRTGNKYYEIYALVGLGNEYDAMGEKRKAMEFYLEALDLCKQTGEKRMYASALARIGVVHAEKGNLGEANRYIDQAMEIVEETGFWDIKAEVISAKAAILGLDGKIDEAEDAYLEAIHLYQGAGAEESAMEVYCDMAEMFIKIGRKNEAKAILENALKFYSGRKFLKSKAEKVEETIRKLEKA